MDRLEPVRTLITEGRFRDAFRLLEQPSTTVSKRANDILMVEVLERIGRYGQCRVLAESLLRAKDLGDKERSSCEFVLGLMELNNGNTKQAVARFNRAISLANQGGDLERKCWFQLRLLVTVADASGPDATTPLLADIRVAATKLGLHRITAALHVFVGEIEAKRGLIKSAERHTRLGLRILAVAPNLWLQTNAENTAVALAIMRSDIEAGFRHARLSLQLAEQCGIAPMLRASLGNYGNLLLAAGEFEAAVDYFQKAITAMPSAGDNYFGGVDATARAHLFQDRLSECADLIAQIDESVRTPDDRVQYARRYAQLTRTQLLARQMRLPEALASAESLMQLAEQAGDHLLQQVALLTKAELLQQAGNVPEAMETLAIVVRTLPQQPPDLYAQYERILACALLDAGDRDSATRHLARARRLYESIRSAPGLLELSRRWDETVARVAKRTVDAGEAVDGFCAE